MHHSRDPVFTTGLFGVFFLLLAAPVVAHEDVPAEQPVLPAESFVAPDQRLIISEPFPLGAYVKPPEKIEVSFRRFEFDLIPSTLEVWVDGAEITESLRVWIDSAWMETPPGFWTSGSHTITATILDATGAQHSESGTFDLFLDLPPTEFPMPVGPSAITNLFEDYQDFITPEYWHRGLDIRADEGTPVLASRGGTVVQIDHYYPGDAYWSIGIQDNDGFVWQYHHVDPDTRIVNENDLVAQGDTLGDIIAWTKNMNGHLYHHLHLNITRWLGGGAVPGPYVDGFEYHNPLAFLDLPPNLDTTPPEFQEVFFAPNESDIAFARDSDPGKPVLMGDVDIVGQVRDSRDEVLGIPGHPYRLGVYKLSYSVVPTGGDCFLGWIPKKTLVEFQKIPYGTILNTHYQMLFEIFRDIVHFGFGSWTTNYNYSVQRFLYTFTNAQWGVVNADSSYWNTDWVNPQGPVFPDGNYEVKLYAEDFYGNETVYTTQVELSNGLSLGAFCPSQITLLWNDGGGDDKIWLDTPSGPLSSPVGRFPINFATTSEGSAVASVAEAEIPVWTFPDPASGKTYRIQPRSGETAEVEYVPYLGDVILEIPAEVHVETPGGPTEVAPVDLRLSTRLARNEDTSAAWIGTPQTPGGTDFSLVMADPVTVGAENLMIRSDADGVDLSWVIGIIGVETPSSPAPTAALQVFPNPFRARTHIRYQGDGQGTVHLQVLDLQGRVRRTFSRQATSEAQEWAWDGRDDEGRSLPAGIYFIQAEGAGVVGPRKIVKM